MRKNRGIAANLKKTLRSLRAAARRVLKNGADEAGEEWLGDNITLLQEALRGGLALLRRSRGASFDRAFGACLAYTERRDGTDAAGLRAAFAPLGADTAVCEALPALLAAAAACRAADRVKEKAPNVMNAVKFIFSLREIDFNALLPEICEAERLLMQDPAAVYALMDDETRETYRRRLRAAAKKAGSTEPETAARILAKAKAENRHVGFYLLPPPPPPPVGFLLTEALVPVLAAALLSAFCARESAGFFGSPAGAALLFFLTCPPLFAAARPLFDRLAAAYRKPRALPAMHESLAGLRIPESMITVASVLPAASEEDKVFAHLRELYATNSVPGTRLCALFDPRNAKTPVLSTDKADTQAAKRVIDRLNAEFGGGFLLALRAREYAPTENEYAARERKRGAVEALVRQIKTGRGGFTLLYGDRDVRGVKYLLMLDADTRLPFEGLRRLLAVALHPCNRAVVRGDRTVSGYGCFSPRTETDVRAAGGTVFSSLFTRGGAGAYHPRVSERNMDLFGTGLFCGKGLIDADAYYETCADAFARGEVLSHDVLEGALLGTAFVGDVVLTEHFPESPGAYYKRLGRWIRGDVQNLRYLFRPFRRHRPHVRADAVTKLRLAENVRRAVSPVFAAADLLLAAFLPGPAGRFLYAAALAATLAPDVLSFCFSVLREGTFPLLRRYYVRILPETPRALAAAVTALSFLPMTAAVSLDALLRGLYRTFVSKRKTLEWTPAAQSDGAGMRAFSVGIPLLFSVGLLTGGAATGAAAALILLGIPFAASDGIRLRTRSAFPGTASKETLRAWAAAAWNYFETYADEKNHFLPPDNVQFTPVRRTARRTSPTNIGLYLTSLLAAADLSLIPPEEMSRRISLTLDTVESLPKYRGLLYNWYDTVTLRPLAPAFISAVDCGNYLVCLTALREGLREYAPLGLGLESLIRRTDALLRTADLGFLYRENRRLFAVGYDVSAQRYTDACYDTYMSEARMTSLYAAAKRIVPAGHWARLDRRTIRSGLHTAVLSYSGTAFEYFMPTLFLPVYPNSFQDEGLRACLAAQKRFAGGRGLPYGLSESGYYDFDPDLNYAYKAHGLQALALKRDPAQEPVFAPYASFLFLKTDPAGSMRNLARFAALGAYGECGFYEAVDFSDRTGREDYLPVRSYMAHHVGMSLLAAANALTGDAFVRRFCRDRDVNAACGMLAECAPAEAPAVRRTAGRRPVARKAQPHARGAACRGTALYADGELSLLCDESGRNRLLYAGLELTAFTRRSPGVFAAAGTPDGIVPLTGRVPFSLTGTGCLASVQAGQLRIRTAAALISGTSALAVPVKIENGGKTALPVEFLWYLEPLFLPPEKENAHPAFADMGLRAEYESACDALLFYRTGRGETGPCFAVTLGDRAPFLFACDRETVLGCDPDRRWPFENRRPTFDCAADFRSPAAAVRATATLAPGARAEKILLLVPGATKNEALNRCAALRRGRLPDLRRAVPEILMREPGGFTGRQFIAAVFFGGRLPKETPAGEQTAVPPAALWEKGISGDLPLLRVNADALPERETAAAVLLHKKLKDCGIRADLLLFTDRPADYDDPAAGELRALFRQLKAAPAGGSGGVHLLNVRTCSPAFLAAARNAKGIDFPAAEHDAAILPQPEPDPPRAGEKLFGGETLLIPGGCLIGTTPPRPWSHTLSNPVFGTMVSWGSLGFTWAMNARLNPLTPWSGDVCTGNTGERLLFTTRGAVYDCVRNAAVWFYPEKAVYGTLCGGVKIRVTVETDRRAMKKRLTVACADPPPDAAFVYEVRPRACERARDASYVRIVCENGAATFSNPANTDYPGAAAVYADGEASAQTDGETLTLRRSAADGAGEIRFYFCFSADARGLGALRALPFLPQPAVRDTFSTGLPALDAFAGALLRHQAINARVLARTGFYQCSGAFGFRDQLQDVMHLCAAEPQRAKIQILRCAAAQFPEGDVLHWYHVIGGRTPRLKGVRTRCSDDMLWLPLAAARYVRETGDETLPDLYVRFLAGAPLQPEERERYAEYAPADHRATVYEHCLRAIDRACRFGRRGLPLMGTGDWNDAFDAVGEKGEGESVWLAMFLRLVCTEFSALCAKRGDDGTRDRLRRTAETLAANVVRHAFNGEWFLRGFFDDGAALGDRGAAACGIDLTVQALASLSDTGTPAMRRGALEAAYDRLFDREAGIVRLFTPPFSETGRRAGYVNDYPAGVRENGGQYTHAAVWFAAALHREGMDAQCREVLRAILPNRKTGAAAARFANEPYALTADVRGEGAYAGAGGWSLYTGAAGTLWALCRILS